MDLFVDCAACGGTGELQPGNGCACCCMQGFIPWDSLRPEGQQAALTAGRLPWRFERVPVELEPASR
jgi:hypothetical protein